MSENKSPPWGVLAATGASVAGVAGAISIVKEDGPTIVRAVLFLAIVAAGFAAYLGRARLQATLAGMAEKRKRLFGLAFLGIGLAAIALVFVRPGDMAEAPAGTMTAAGPSSPGDAPPDLANMSMEGGPMDPNAGSFGVPSHGDGSSLFAYHKRANARSILGEQIDSRSAKAWFDRNEALPILRNYCRIDPYAGVLALQIIPLRDRILVRTQGSKNSVLGRAQTYEPALARIDAEAAKERSAPSASCSGKSCAMDLSDGSRLTIRWSETPQEVVVKDGSNEETDWFDCRCQYSGSFILCEGVKEFGKFAN